MKIRLYLITSIFFILLSVIIYSYQNIYVPREVSKQMEAYTKDMKSSKKAFLYAVKEIPMGVIINDEILNSNTKTLYIDIDEFPMLNNINNKEALLGKEVTKTIERNSTIKFDNIRN